MRNQLGLVLQRFSRISIIVLVVVICAGNITNSFFLKWGFRDDQRPEIYNADNYLESYSLAGMMHGSAPKPFVYRAAVPRAIKWAVDRLDPAFQAKSVRGHQGIRFPAQELCKRAAGKILDRGGGHHLPRPLHADRGA